MSQGKPIPQVKSGPPLWLWVLLVPVTLVIIAAVVITSIPEDPEQIYQSTLKSLEDRNADEYLKNIARLKAFPDYEAHVWYLEGRYAASETRDVKALELYRTAFEKSDGELKPIVLEQIGTTQTRMRQFQDAIKSYEQAIELTSGGAQTPRLALARLYYSVGAHTLSENTTDTILEQDENNSDARALRGSIRREQGRYEEALSDLQSLLLTPGDRAAANPEVIKDCAECLLKVGTDEQITKFYSENKDLIADDYLNARLQVRTGDTESVRTLLNGESELGRYTGRTEKVLALLEIEEGNFDRADEAISSILSTLTRDRHMFEIAAIIFRETKDEERLSVVEENLKLMDELQQQFLDEVKQAGTNVTDFDARMKIADLKKQLGDLEGARKWLIMAGLLDPEKAMSAADMSMLLFERLPMLKEFPDSPASPKEEEKTEAADADAKEAPASSDAGTKDTQTKGTQTTSEPEEKPAAAKSDDAPAKDSPPEPKPEPEPKKTEDDDGSKPAPEKEPGSDSTAEE